MMSAFSLPVAEKSMACPSKMEACSTMSNICEKVRKEAVIRNLVAPFISASDGVLTSSHPTGFEYPLQDEKCGDSNLMNTFDN